MSSLGTARAVAVRNPTPATSGAMDVAGVALGATAGAVALVGVAAVGAAILIGKGVIWCGEKLEENYQNACQEYTSLVDRARAENMQNVQEMGSYLADQVDYLAISASLAVGAGGPAHPDAIDIQKQQMEQQQQQLGEAFAHTHQLLADAQQLAQNRADTRQMMLATQLRAEIAAAQGQLPAEVIADAQAALDGTSAEMQQALERLQDAWGRIADRKNARERATLQARQTLQAVYTQLTAIETLQQNISDAASSVPASRRMDIEQLVHEAEANLDIQPMLALARARSAEQAARQLIELISDQVVAVWSQHQKELNTLRGMLASLASMLQEANSIQLLDAGQVGGLSEQVRQTRISLDALLDAAVATPQQLARMKARVNLLKQEVFTLIGTTQQRNVAQTVVATLAELGFQASDGKQQGKVVHVQAVAKADPTEQRNERVVSFDIAPDGAIAYDFSGYIGDSCVNDAQRIFTALRQKGIFILDDSASAVLRHIPTESITADLLQDARFAPEVVKNKTQAELAESLLRVLQKMGYPTIQQRTVGGFIELEAFKGSVGYRVVLSPEGQARILKDAQRTDVSADAHDPLAAEAQRVAQQEQEVEEEAEEVQAEPHRPVILPQKRKQAQG